MTRDDLVEVAAQLLAAARYGDPEAKANTWHRNIAAVIVDVIEPLIRADAKKLPADVLSAIGNAVRADERLRLRRQVQAQYDDESDWTGRFVYAKVLDLIDGASDE